MKVVKRKKKYREHKNAIICANCEKEFEESDYGLLCNQILNHKPACSYDCNKILGQTS